MCGHSDHAWRTLHQYDKITKDTTAFGPRLPYDGAHEPTNSNLRLDSVPSGNLPESPLAPMLEVLYPALAMAHCMRPRRSCKIRVG